MKDQKKVVLNFLHVQEEACEKIIEACDKWKIFYLKLAYMNVLEVLRQYEEDVKELKK